MGAYKHEHVRMTFHTPDKYRVSNTQSINPAGNNIFLSLVDEHLVPMINDGFHTVPTGLEQNHAVHTAFALEPAGVKGIWLLTFWGMHQISFFR